MEWKDGRLLLPNGAALRVTTRGARADVRWNGGALELCVKDAGEATGDDTIELAVEHPVQSPVHVWVPHLAPEPGNVIGRLRSSARRRSCSSRTRAIALAFVVDVDDVRRARRVARVARLRSPPLHA